MWVVKLGGSLNRSPELPRWLEMLAQLGGGRVIIVPGGGGMADEVRGLQAHWHFNDLCAHNMAVLAMAQSAWLLRGLQPELQVATQEAGIAPALRQAQTVVWAPLELVRQQPDALTTWDVTSDSIALGLALRLNAECLLVVKSCDPGEASLDELSGREVLDRHFPHLVRQAGFPIHVLHSGQCEDARAMLLGQAPGLPASRQRIRRPPAPPGC
jgi:5-(aminomethyl)-3-furanmethanol phosphate kinase